VRSLPTFTKKSIAAALAILLTWLGSYAAYVRAYTIDLIDWECAVGSCGTNDARANWILVVIFCMLAASALAAYSTGLLGLAFAIAIPSYWGRVGIADAVADGHSSVAATGLGIGFTTAGFVVSALLAALWVWSFVRSRIALRRGIERRNAN
jgi:hypothetical protein